jgi:alkylation response protein AidB-like acyl-CoA dehydrogenase
MDFAWSDQQRELLSAVDRFAKDQLVYDMIENDRNGVFNHDAWKKCGGFGVQGLPVSEEYGGLAQDPITTVAACGDHSRAAGVRCPAVRRPVSRGSVTRRASRASKGQSRPGPAATRPGTPA